jgi:hypothetical protein
MILLWAALFGLIVGFLRGGNVTNLSHIQLHGAWLIIIALLIQLSIFNTGFFAPPIHSNIGYWHLASYFALVLFALLNWRQRAMWPMALGLLSNFVVIAVNQGHMPVSLEALRALGADNLLDTLQTNATKDNVMLMCAQLEPEVCTRQTYLNFLGDIFWLPRWVPMTRPFSLGDILLGVGLIYFLQLRMRLVSS